MQIQRTDYISSVGGAITTLTNKNFSIMKKKFLITSIAVAAMAIGGGVFVRTALVQSDPILEANVEALANGETADGFNTVLKIESSHTLICRGSGNLECKW